MKKILKCITCGGKFYSKSDRRLNCSSKCSRKYWREVYDRRKYKK